MEKTGQMKKTNPVCPNCGAEGLVNRAPQSVWYKYIIFWQKYKRFKCFSCQEKVYIKVNDLPG